jgi:hypothetical protein
MATIRMGRCRRMAADSSLPFEPGLPRLFPPLPLYLRDPDQGNLANGQWIEKGRNGEPSSSKDRKSTKDRHFNPEKSGTASVGSHKISFRDDSLGVKLNPPAPKGKSGEEQSFNESHGAHCNRYSQAATARGSVAWSFIRGLRGSGCLPTSIESLPFEIENFSRFLSRRNFPRRL